MCGYVCIYIYIDIDIYIYIYIYKGIGFHPTLRSPRPSREIKGIFFLNPHVQFQLIFPSHACQTRDYFLKPSVPQRCPKVQRGGLRQNV